MEARQVGARAGNAPWDHARHGRRQGARRAGRRSPAEAAARLEKLALEKASAPGRGPQRSSVEEIERRAAHSSEWRAYALADALVGGDAREATLSYLRLREQGERVSGLTYLMAQRLRDAVAVAQRLQAGDSVAEVKRGLRMPARAAERFVADVARSDVGSCRRRSARSRTSSSTRAGARRSVAAAHRLRRCRRGHAGASRDRDDYELA